MTSLRHLSLRQVAPPRSASTALRFYHGRLSQPPPSVTGQQREPRPQCRGLAAGDHCGGARVGVGEGIASGLDHISRPFNPERLVAAPMGAH
jgi:hypothetical protein